MEKQPEFQEEPLNDDTTTVAELSRRVVKFRDDRDWKQFHKPKDLAIAMAIEAAEVLELCRFKPDDEVALEVAEGRTQEYAHELADVFSYLLSLADILHIDLSRALQEKMVINDRHYPVELAKGRKVKYTELGTADNE